MRWLRAALAALFLCAPVVAGAQAIQQGGPWQPGHAPMYVGSGFSTPIVQDSGPAGGGGPGVGLSELLLTMRGTAGTGPYGTNLCDYDAPITNPTGYHYLCFGPSGTGGAGVIAYGNAGTAAAEPLNFYYNGTLYPFPFVVGGIVGPGTTVSGDLACWNNTSGTLLKDCGTSITLAGLLVGGPLSSTTYLGGTPLLAQYFAGQVVNNQAVISSIGVSTTFAEGALFLSMVDNVGYSNKLTAYKATLQDFVYCTTSNAADCWSAVFSTAYDTTAPSNISTVGIELDFNNGNRNCEAPDSTYCVGLLITSPNQGFYSAAAIDIESTSANWNNGIYFNGDAIRTNTIVDSTESATSYAMGGNHTTGLDGSLGTFAAYFIKGTAGSYWGPNGGFYTVVSGGAPNAGYNVMSVSPAVALEATGGSTDSKWWQISATPSQFVIGAVNDAGSAENVAIQINRGSGYTIASVLVNAPLNVAYGLTISSAGSYVPPSNCGSLSGSTKCLVVIDPNGNNLFSPLYGTY